MDFAYYLLASSTNIQTQSDDSSSPGWCLEFTSHQDMADYVRKQANFPIIFGIHTQGRSADGVVADVDATAKTATSTTNQTTSTTAVDQKQTVDHVKGELGRALRQLLGKTLINILILRFF